MNEEIKSYLRLETTVSAAFNFFINGMIAALIYHKTDFVPIDPAAITIDITVTCLLLFIITAFFSRTSLKRNKTSGILKSGRRLIKRISIMFQHPILYIVLGLAFPAVLWLLITPVLFFTGIKAIPFGAYILVKSLLCALFGGLLTLSELYIGMISQY